VQHSVSVNYWKTIRANARRGLRPIKTQSICQDRAREGEELGGLEAREEIRIPTRGSGGDKGDTPFTYMSIDRLPDTFP
jgi:hypothetical protein